MSRSGQQVGYISTTVDDCHNPYHALFWVVGVKYEVVANGERPVAFVVLPPHVGKLGKAMAGFFKVAYVRPRGFWIAWVEVIEKGVKIVSGLIQPDDLMRHTEI